MLARGVIRNAIIVRNYLYLSAILSRLTTQQEAEELARSIRNGTIIHWAHVNFHGEYGFTKIIDFTKPRFDLESILNRKLDLAAYYQKNDFPARLFYIWPRLVKVTESSNPVNP